jgi:hypothetical protein
VQLSFFTQVCPACFCTTASSTQQAPLDCAPKSCNTVWSVALHHACQTWIQSRRQQCGPWSTAGKLTKMALSPGSLHMCVCCQKQTFFLLMASFNQVSFWWVLVVKWMNLITHFHLLPRKIVYVTLHPLFPMPSWCCGFAQGQLYLFQLYVKYKPTCTILSRNYRCKWGRYIMHF